MTTWIAACVPENLARLGEAPAPAVCEEDDVLADCPGCGHGMWVPLCKATLGAAGQVQLRCWVCADAILRTCEAVTGYHPVPAHG